MDYVTVAEASDALGVSPRTLRRWIMDGEVQAEPVHSNLLLVPVSEVARLRDVGPKKRGPKIGSRRSGGSTAPHASSGA